MTSPMMSRPPPCPLASISEPYRNSQGRPSRGALAASLPSMASLSSGAGLFPNVTALSRYSAGSERSLVKSAASGLEADGALGEDHHGAADPWPIALDLRLDAAG